VQEGTLVLAFREEHDSGLRARDHREERGDGERQHRRSNHRRGDRGASARDAVSTKNLRLNVKKTRAARKTNGTFHHENGQLVASLAVSARAMEGEAVAVDGATHLRRAEDALKAGDALQAAASFAAAGDAAPFESTALGFLDRGEDDALALYLRSRLDAADPAREPETVSKLAAWLADLHVSRACGAERGTPAAEAATKDLRLFFAAHASRLDKEATKKLLAEFGLEDDLAHFAEIVGDVREAMELRLERGDVQGVFQTLRTFANKTSSPECVDDVLARAFRADAEATSAFLSSRGASTALGGDECLSETLGELCETMLVETNVFAFDAEDTVNGAEQEHGTRRREDDKDDVEKKKFFLRRRAADLLRSATRDGRVTSPRARDAWRRAAADLVRAGFGCAPVAGSGPDADADAASLEAEMAAEARRAREDAELDAKMLREMRYGLRAADEEDAARDAREARYRDEGGDFPWEDGDPTSAFAAFAAFAAAPDSERLRSAALAETTSRAVSATEAARDASKRARVVRSALALADESNGALTMEFVLRCLPDATVLDEVRDATLAELRRHALEAESCAEETRRARELESKLLGEIAERRTMEVTIPWDEPCASCGSRVVAPPASSRSSQTGPGQAEKKTEVFAPYYAFPCGMAFHGVCLLEALLPVLPAERRARCLDLLAATRAPLPRALRRKCKEYARRERDRRDPPGEPAPVARGADGGDDVSGAAKERKLDAAKEKETPETLKAQLEDLLCEECPFCGEASIALIDAPFVGPDEAEEAESWRSS
jgi:hypothetical protein